MTLTGSYWPLRGLRGALTQLHARHCKCAPLTSDCATQEQQTQHEQRALTLLRPTHPSGVLFGLSCVGYQSDSITVSLQLTPCQGQAHQTSVAALQAFHDLLLMAVWGLSVLLQD